ncbi:leukotriene C4 synthase isoform X1 [Manis javanica]|uniref:leukotriene C4 synthase isoform X1 n=1 Tax=Manis javanica TaxID=9974 RepID=UPI003C6D2EE4
MLCPAPAPSGSGFRPLSLTRLLVLSGCAHTPAPHPHTEKGRREWATLLRGQPLRSTGTEKSSAASPAPGPDGAACTMKDEVALLATVTLLGVLLQAYFSLRVISARRAFRVAPPLTTGPPEFERVYRAQVNCSEYFPLFLATLWVAGIFFHEGAAALCGLVYLFARLRYFQGYSLSVQQRGRGLLSLRPRRAPPVGLPRCTRARERSGCLWCWRRSACSPTSSRPRCAPRYSDSSGRYCPGPETQDAQSAEREKSRSLPEDGGGVLAPVPVSN